MLGYKSIQVNSSSFLKAHNFVGTKFYLFDVLPTELLAIRNRYL